MGRFAQDNPRTSYMEAWVVVTANSAMDGDAKLPPI